MRGAITSYSLLCIEQMGHSCVLAPAGPRGVLHNEAIKRAAACIAQRKTTQTKQRKLTAVDGRASCLRLPSAIDAPTNSNRPSGTRASFAAEASAADVDGLGMRETS